VELQGEQTSENYGKLGDRSIPWKWFLVRYSHKASKAGTFANNAHGGESITVRFINPARATPQSREASQSNKRRPSASSLQLSMQLCDQTATTMKQSQGLQNSSQPSSTQEFQQGDRYSAGMNFLEGHSSLPPQSSPHTYYQPQIPHYQPQTFNHQSQTTDLPSVQQQFRGQVSVFSPSASVGLSSSPPCLPQPSSLYNGYPAEAQEFTHLPIDPSLLPASYPRHPQTYFESSSTPSSTTGSPSSQGNASILLPSPLRTLLSSSDKVWQSWVKEYYPHNRQEPVGVTSDAYL
jgi:hypothetical protein